MGRPRQLSDEQILDTARACFLTHGPHVATAVIAEQLGLSQAALFKRFGSKSRLLVAALRPPPVPPWVNLLEEGPDNRPIDAQLVELCLAIARYFEAMVPCMMMLKASGARVGEVLGQDEMPPPARGHHALVSWLRRGQRLGLLGDFPATVLANALLGAVSQRSFVASLAGPEALHDDLEDYVTALVKLLLRGLEPAPEGPPL